MIIYYTRNISMGIHHFTIIYNIKRFRFVFKLGEVLRMQIGIFVHMKTFTQETNLVIKLTKLVPPPIPLWVLPQNRAIL